VMENTYDFFMLFVVMAGIASIVLFILSKRLQKLMHGIK
jgi:proton-dependent oligopeptide transporter, POT family